MSKYLIIFFFVFVFTTAVNASGKDKIIQNLNKIENISFNFKQTISEKLESGICTIKYPKKIYCEYNGFNKKIIVSDGKQLVIKDRVNSKAFYLYPLAKTPLEYLLDKKYLISKIQNLEMKIINNKYENFKIIENNNKINIFFDNKTFNLIGWQTEDIYKNLSITQISPIAINNKLNDKIFIIPQRD